MALDKATGIAYYGESGYISSNINKILTQRMPAESLEKWAIENCAEFNAVNNALNRGAKIEDLMIYTIKTKSLEPFSRCKNCIITTDGALILSD